MADVDNANAEPARRASRRAPCAPARFLDLQENEVRRCRAQPLARDPPLPARVAQELDAFIHFMSDGGCRGGATEAEAGRAGEAEGEGEGSGEEG